MLNLPKLEDPQRKRKIWYKIFTLPQSIEAQIIKSIYPKNVCDEIALNDPLNVIINILAGVNFTGKSLSLAEVNILISISNMVISCH